MADIRIHDITGEVTIARFPRAEAKALKPISGIPPFRATRELIRRVGSDCTVEIDGNAYWAIDPADYAGVAGANGRYAATPPPACMPATAPASLVRDLSFRTALSELPQPIHSISRLARTSSAGGTSSPSALAVLRLITSSNFVGCSIGKSPGLAPLKIS
jgi:hypothetical protein